MMKNISTGVLLIFSLWLCFVLSTGCKQAGKRAGASSAAHTSSAMAGAIDTLPLNIQKGGNYRSLDQIRVMALKEIERRSAEEPEAQSMLTFTAWTPEFVHNKGKFSKPGEYDGHWIQFGEDLTYTYGLHKKILGGGKYHFSLDDKQLFMVDDDFGMEPKVWLVNHSGEVLTFVGTHIFGINNGMQMKFIPIDIAQ